MECSASKVNEEYSAHRSCTKTSQHATRLDWAYALYHILYDVEYCALFTNSPLECCSMRLVRTGKKPVRICQKRRKPATCRRRVGHSVALVGPPKTNLGVSWAGASCHNKASSRSLWYFKIHPQVPPHHKCRTSCAWLGAKSPSAGGRVLTTPPQISQFDCIAE